MVARVTVGDCVSFILNGSPVLVFIFTMCPWYQNMTGCATKTNKVFNIGWFDLGVDGVGCAGVPILHGSNGGLLTRHINHGTLVLPRFFIAGWLC